MCGLCAALPAEQILFVGPARDVSHHIRRGTLSQLRGEATWAIPDLPNVTVTRPLKLFPNTLAAGRKINERISRSHIRQTAAADWDHQIPFSGSIHMMPSTWWDT